MNAALDYLLKTVIDYAGLFPPADLNLAEAINTFSADLKGTYRAWLRHFILPAARITEFDSLREKHGRDSQWTLSLIMGGGESLHDWQTSLEDVLEPFATRDVKHTDRVRVLEIALPLGIAADAPSFTQAIESLERQLAPTPLVDCTLFFETTSADHRRILAEVLAARKSQKWKLGLKLRTGGLTRDHFPSFEQLADFIRLCHSLDIPWKATAGLHHPLPIDCKQTDAKMHGFLNLLFAVILLEGNSLAGDQVENLLTDQNPDHFVFRETGIEWMGITASVEQVQLGRERFLSFGSCSFAEPLEDLAALGLLRD